MKEYRIEVQVVLIVSAENAQIARQTGGEITSKIETALKSVGTVKEVFFMDDNFVDEYYKELFK